MARYVVRRVIQAVPLLFGISIVAFVLLQLMPGGPTTIFFGQANVSAEDIARIERELGLDQPIFVQYVTWLGKFLQGDWGTSFVSRRPVFDMVAERVPATLLLMISAILVSVLISIPLGILAAVKRETKVDHALTFFSFVGLSIPIFWLGLMLIIIFSVIFPILPGGGIGPPGEDPDLITRVRYLILPTVALSLVSVGFFTRYLRASLIEVLRTDYMRFARARGVPPRSLYVKHGFRNAAIPYLTVVALHIPDLLIGALVVETIFSWPGTGRLFWESAIRFDYAVLMGILVIGSVVVLLSNLAADVLYGVLDPRVRYD
ncbi:MAG: ABC transporter permease [Chloroflexota bacterium]